MMPTVTAQYGTAQYTASNPPYQFVFSHCGLLDGDHGQGQLQALADGTQARVHGVCSSSRVEQQG